MPNKASRRTNGLKGRLAASFFTLTAVVTVLVGGMGLYFSYSSQRQAVAEGQQRLAVGAAADVTARIQEIVVRLETLGESARFLGPSLDDFRNAMNRILVSSPALRQLNLLDTAGHSLEKASRLSSVSSIDFGEYFDQAALASREGRPFVSRTTIDPITEEPLVVVATPVSDAFGEFMGILFAEVNLKFMWDLVRQIDLDSDGLSYVVDDTGALLAFGDSSRVLKGENLARLQGVQTFMHAPSSTEATTLAPVKGILGTWVTSTTVPIGVPHWAVTIESPLLTAYGPVIGQVLMLLFAMLAIYGLSVLVSVYYSNKISEPIIRLRDVAVAIGKGNLDQEIEVTELDEIGDLAKGLRQMTGDLKKSKQALDDYNHRLEDRQKELEIERYKLNIVANDITIGTVLLDENGQVLYSNNAARKFLDLSDGETEGDAVRAPLEKWFSSHALSEQLPSCLAGTAISVPEFKDGARTFSITSRCIPKLGGGYSGHLMWMTDITESKLLADLTASRQSLLETLAATQREKRIAEQERERSETILRSIGDGVFVVDREGRLVMINHEAEAMAGLKNGVVLGQPYSKTLVFKNEKSKEEVGKFVSEAMTTGQITRPRGEISLMSPDGSALAVTVNAAPLVHEEAVFGAVIVIHDETREREVNRLKSEFVSIASHQLRAPLTAIKWSLELVVSDDENCMTAEQREVLADASTSVERLVRLVNDLLNVSRLESGRVAIVPKPTDMDVLCRGVVSGMAPTAAAKGQELIGPTGGLGVVDADGKLVEQALTNLLSNAIKYTPKGGQIEVGGSRTEQEVKIFVRDTGMGIPREAQAHMFDKFYRAENAVKSSEEGTGLGLFLVKAVIESSGGRVWFESEINQGSTFWIALPLVAVATAGDRTLSL